MEEVKIAIDNAKNKSAPGNNLITYEILKNLPLEAVQWLTKLYEYIRCNSIFPELVDEYVVCFILKPGKKGLKSWKELSITEFNGIVKIIG